MNKLNFQFITTGFVLALGLGACAIYPDIPEKHLSSSRVETSKKSAVSTHKFLPPAPQKLLYQFTEVEKELIVSQVFKSFQGEVLLDPEKARNYPDLLKFGNEIVLMMDYAVRDPGSKKLIFLNEKVSGVGGNILENAAFAGKKLRDFKTATTMPSESIRYMTLELTPLEFLLIPNPPQWVEIVGESHFLPLDKLNFRFLYERFLLNRRFLTQQWGVMLSEEFKSTEDPATFIDAWLRLIQAQPDIDVSTEKEMKEIQEDLIAQVHAYDSDLSFVRDTDGKLDVASTVALVLLLAKEDQSDANETLELLSNALFFLQNEDGSFQSDIDTTREMTKSDLRIPLLLKAYYVLYQRGDTTFLDAFKKSFHFYSKGKFEEKEVESRAAWTRLLLDLTPSYDEFPYEKALQSNLNWLFRHITLPGQTGKDLTGSFNIEVDKKIHSSVGLRMVELVTEGYSYFKESSPSELPEDWEVRLFFAYRYFMNQQILEYDLYTSYYPPETIGGFKDRIYKQLLQVEDQMVATHIFKLALHLWGTNEWERIKEKAEALL